MNYELAPVVLVVEDEWLLRLLAVELIEDAGFVALQAGNADEAIAILEHRNGHRAGIHGRRYARNYGWSQTRSRRAASVAAYQDYNRLRQNTFIRCGAAIRHAIFFEALFRARYDLRTPVAYCSSLRLESRLELRSRINRLKNVLLAHC
jgi:CheY-like chemotaxis protein